MGPYSPWEGGGVLCAPLYKLCRYVRPQRDQKVIGSTPAVAFVRHTPKTMLTCWSGCYGVFSHDVTAAILVYQNNETATMLVYQTNPVGVELFSYVKDFFCSNKFAWLMAK